MKISMCVVSFPTNFGVTADWRIPHLVDQQRVGIPNVSIADTNNLIVNFNVKELS